MMKLLRGLNRKSDFSRGCVATVGNFDGVHLGHQALLKALKKEADRLELPVVLLLFEPQPAEYFYPESAPARLTSLREKLAVLKHCGVDYVACLQFNKRLALMSAQVFAEYYFFSALGCRYLLVGQDFRFGQGRLGDVNLLKELSAKQACTVDVFSDFSLKDQRVSSTKIRHALSQAELEHSAELLGRSFSLCGRVIRGDGRGKTWGIPTANLNIRRNRLPLKGVFCVKVLRRNGALVEAVANLGSRPTIDGTKNNLEVHLIDFEGDLYGEVLEVFFLHKLRDEVKFLSVDALISQIHDDVAAARSAFRKCCFNINFL